MSEDTATTGTPGGRTGTVLIAAVGLCIAALAVGAFWVRERQLIAAAHPWIEGVLPAPGLDAPTRVRRDARGVPHIVAEGERDLWFSLGFVHAQDRLGQMLWLRRVAQGRAAEWAGESALRSDRFARTIGFALLASDQLERLPDATRAILDAYARGASLRIARVRDDKLGLPSALRALGVDASELDDWQASDSLAVFKLLCWGTGAPLDSGQILDRLTQRLGGVGARPFEPKREVLQTISVPFQPPPADAASAASRPARERSDHLVPRLDGGTAWVLSGRHTASGSPILAADLHFAPTAPSLVHVAHLRAPGVGWVGAAVPGVPIFWVGRSDVLAWAVLPARAVNSVYFAETLRPRRPVPLYNDGFRWLPVEERVETIGVRQATGGRREETWTVRSTRHGPLIDGLLEETDTSLSLGWTGALEGDGVSSLMGLARARSASEARAALEPHHEPVVSAVFADAEGAAGYQVAGWLPRRILPTSLQPVPGRLRTYDLGPRVPFSALPARDLDDTEEADWIAVSDAPLPGREKEADDIEWLWRSGARAARLERLLDLYRARGRVDLRDATSVQADVISAFAPGMVRGITALLGDAEAIPPEALEMLDLLREWNGELAPNRAAAAVHAVLVEELTRGLFSDAMGGGLFDRYRALPQADLQSVTRGVLLTAARETQADGWSKRERVREAVLLALRRTWARLTHELGANRERWSWGRLQHLDFASFVPGPTASIETPRAIGGGPGTLAVAEHDAELRVTRAALYRMAVDLGVKDEMLFALAPGQFEQLDHPHRSDGLGDWIAGRASVLRTSPRLIESGAERLLTLEPGP